MKKLLAVAIMILFISVSVIPSTGNIVSFDDDTTPPEIELEWEGYEKDGKWYLRFNATCFDNESGMNRVEFYLNDILQDTIIGPGPIYEWELKSEIESYSIKGFICQRRITEENISFFALILTFRALWATRLE